MTPLTPLTAEREAEIRSLMAQGSEHDCSFALATHELLLALDAERAARVEAEQRLQVVEHAIHGDPLKLNAYGRRCYDAGRAEAEARVTALRERAKRLENTILDWCEDRRQDAPVEFICETILTEVCALSGDPAEGKK